MAHKFFLAIVFLSGIVLSGCNPTESKSTLRCNPTETDWPPIALNPVVVERNDSSESKSRLLHVMFAAPLGGQVSSDGVGLSTDETLAASNNSWSLIIPGRQDILQGSIYRLKVTKVPGQEGMEFHANLETGQSLPRTESDFAQNVVAIELTEEDIGCLSAGRFVTKVAYLPDLEFRGSGVDSVVTLSSTHLASGLDPIIEADRRGSIMTIFRIRPPR